jgi:hypothetical protein
MRTTVPKTPLEEVLEELQVIPRGDFHQNTFRAVCEQCHTLRQGFADSRGGAARDP